MIEKIFNKPQTKERRRKLRNEMTRAECKLWQFPRRRNLRGYKFRRQYSVNPYIVDFYCPQLKLAIEVDGDTHLTDEEIDYDEKRQKHIEEYGIQFLRFSNGDIFNGMDYVLEKINEKIDKLTVKSTLIENH